MIRLVGAACWVIRKRINCVLVQCSNTIGVDCLGRMSAGFVVVVCDGLPAPPFFIIEASS